MKTIRLFIVCALLLAMAIGVLYYIYKRDSEPAITTEPARIVDVRELADLCTVEILSDIPVKGKIGTRNFFARQTIKGNISFPLDSLKVDSGTDTIRLFLPPEKVELLESTAPNSFRVIDVWNTQLIGSSALNNNEENYIKRKAINSATSKLYFDGTVARARSEACSQLAGLLEMTLHHPVVVIDTVPKGYYYSKVSKIKQ